MGKPRDNILPGFYTVGNKEIDHILIMWLANGNAERAFIEIAANIDTDTSCCTLFINENIDICITIIYRVFCKFIFPILYGFD